MELFTFTTECDLVANTLTVNAYNKKEHKYQVEIDDFIACQEPKALLTNMACLEVIADKIKTEEFKHKYHESDDTIEITINYMPKYKIVIMLDRCIAPDLELEYEVVRLKARLDELELDEVVHEHTYPTWASLDDFKKLPGFKFIEAAENPAKYYSMTTAVADQKGLYYLGEHAGEFRYILDNTDNSRNPNYVSKQVIHESMPRFQNDYRTTFGFHMDKQQDYGCVQDRELLETEGEEPHKAIPYRYFPRSVKELVLPNLGINRFAMCYAMQYIYGWILQNHMALAFRQSYAMINVLDNNLYITISRSKKMYMPAVSKKYDTHHVNSVAFYVKNITVNGYDLGHNEGRGSLPKLFR